MLSAIEATLPGRVVAVLRTSRVHDYRPAVAALLDGGIRCIELTLTSPGALAALPVVRAAVAGSGARVGLGTVTAPPQVRQASEAGAEFVVSPVTDPAVVAAATALGLPALPGACTPTEVALAIRAGAAAVKLFPAGALGPDYLRMLLGPFPQAVVVPSGGVAVAEVRRWREAGAVAVSLGGELLRGALDDGDLDGLAVRARDACAAMSDR